MEDIAIVIFGATGDLTHRKLVPALFEVFKKEQNIRLIGVGRRELTREAFVDSFALDDSPQKADFLTHIHYHQGNFDDIHTFTTLKEQLTTQNVVFYLAVEPAYFEPIISYIAQTGLNTPTSRVIIEKPFGNDKADAYMLYKQIRNVFADNQLYIIDHYLGKETVQNILTFRFANGIFESVWNRHFIDSIQITLAEDLGVGNRGGYYDKAGATRDMVQNHILQILAAVCMDQPQSFDPAKIHQKRTELIKKIHTYRENELAQSIVFGQYDGYKQEEKITPDSRTETFVALKTHIDNNRWSGVPIYIRTGKKLNLKVTEVYLQFKKPSQQLFHNPNPNILAFRIQPNEGISLKMSLKEPGKEISLKEVSMDFCYQDSFTISDNSYIRLLMDAIHNDKSLFTSIDEIIASWEFVEPIIAYEKKDTTPIYSYESGSMGPAESSTLIQKDNRTWLSLYPYKCDLNLSM